MRQTSSGGAGGRRVPVSLIAACLLPVAGAASAEPLRVATFGTSLTARGGWQAPLERALSACLGRPVAVDVVAKVGASSDWGLANVHEVTKRRPDVVLVEFAANDAALNRFLTPAASRRNLDAILTALEAGHPRPRLFLMAMSPVYGLRRLLRPFLATYHDLARDLAATRGIGFIDHRPGWARLGEEAARRAIPDGSHPLPEVAAAVMVPDIVRAIAGGTCARDDDGGRPTEPPRGG